MHQLLSATVNPSKGRWNDAFEDFLNFNFLIFVSQNFVVTGEFSASEQFLGTSSKVGRALVETLGTTRETASCDVFVTARLPPSPASTKRIATWLILPIFEMRTKELALQLLVLAGRCRTLAYRRHIEAIRKRKAMCQWSDVVLFGKMGRWGKTGIPAKWWSTLSLFLHLHRDSEFLETEISAASKSALIWPLCLDEIQGRNRQMTSPWSDAEKGRTDWSQWSQKDQAIFFLRSSSWFYHSVASFSDFPMECFVSTFDALGEQTSVVDCSQSRGGVTELYSSQCSHPLGWTSWRLGAAESSVFMWWIVFACWESKLWWLLKPEFRICKMHHHRDKWHLARSMNTWDPSIVGCTWILEHVDFYWIPTDWRMDACPHVPPVQPCQVQV